MKMIITHIKKTVVSKHAVIAFLSMLPVFYAAKINAQIGVTKYGTNALLNNSVTGIYNSAFGYYSLNLNTTGTKNSASGANVLRFNTTGSQNTGSGYASLYSNTTGNYNIGYGAYSLFLNTTGVQNTANGSNSLYNNLNGNYNTANGSSSLYTNVSGHYNTANGYLSLFKNISGYHNTASGFASLYANTGNYNTALGSGSLSTNATGSYNTAIGYSADIINGLSNSIAIGNNTVVDASYKVRIGSTAITSIGGQVSWTTFSDGRYKKEIKENVPGLSFINSLRPVTYTVNVNGLNEYYNKGKKTLPENEANEKADAETEKGISAAGKIVHSGFIAQEVEAAATKLNFTFSGIDKPQSDDGLYGLRYDNFVMPLVKAVQELTAINDKKDAAMDAMQKQIDELKALIINNCKLDANTAMPVNSSLQKEGSASLEQNLPNPFTSNTTIRYNAPKGNAKIIIANTAGNIVKTFNLTTKNNGSVTVYANELAAGTYYYSLIVDGKKTDSKKMILVK